MSPLPQHQGWLPIMLMGLRRPRQQHPITRTLEFLGSVRDDDGGRDNSNGMGGWQQLVAAGEDSSSWSMTAIEGSWAVFVNRRNGDGGSLCKLRWKGRRMME